MKKIAVVLSCEHAVDTIPAEYQQAFKPFASLLATHRGIDFGALDIAKCLQQRLSCPLIRAQSSRLLIDCNRSLHNPDCFSEATKPFSEADKQLIINQFYLPFRQEVTRQIQALLAQNNRVLHLSIHSFTPIMNSVERNADIGFLYDPKRSLEQDIARQWKANIKEITPNIRVRMNYPYLGISDGFTSFLRKKFPVSDYQGIEVESNQRLTQDASILDALKLLLTDSLNKIVS